MKKLVLMVCVVWAAYACTNIENSSSTVRQKVSAAVGEDGGDIDAGDVDSEEVDTQEVDGGDIDTGEVDSEEVDTEEVDGGDIDTGEDSDTVIENPYFWYLRCNATSWNLDAGSQLVDTDDPAVKALVFEVTYPWMVSNGDSCNVMRTEQAGDWAAGLTVFNALTSPVIVPGGGTLAVGFGQFAVRYPEIGTYVFLLNTSDNTFTFVGLEDDGPTCEDGLLNGDETDVDCGGPECDACADGLSCVVNSDCASDHCADGVCETPVSECNAGIAIDLGGAGQMTVVSSDACVKVEAGYPGWWGASRTMNLINTAGSGYPIPFTFENSCGGGAGSGTFTHTWDAKALASINAECATVIDLQGDGSAAITLQYFGF